MDDFQKEYSEYNQAKACACSKHLSIPRVVFDNESVVCCSVSETERKTVYHPEKYSV